MKWNQCKEILIIGLLAAVLSACDGSEQMGSVPVLMTPDRQLDPQQLAMGERVFQANCAVCHGAQAQGAPDWRKRDADGFYPAPPLDGSGHAWHHSLVMLEDMITNGSPDGKGKMPAWKGKLNQQEIQATLAWFQSQWPQPVYDAWYEMQQRGQ